MDIIFDRLKEPSTYASLATGLTLVGVNVPSGFAQGVSFILAGIVCVAAFFLKEKGSSLTGLRP